MRAYKHQRHVGRRAKPKQGHDFWTYVSVVQSIGFAFFLNGKYKHRITKNFYLQNTPFKTLFKTYEHKNNAEIQQLKNIKYSKINFYGGFS